MTDVYVEVKMSSGTFSFLALLHCSNVFSAQLVVVVFAGVRPLLIFESSVLVTNLKRSFSAHRLGCSLVSLMKGQGLSCCSGGRWLDSGAW